MALSGKWYTVVMITCCLKHVNNGKETKNRRLGEFLRLQPSGAEVCPELGVWQWRMVLGAGQDHMLGLPLVFYNHLYCLVCLPMTWDQKEAPPAPASS